MRVLLIALLAAISYAQTEDSFCSEHIPVNGAESARVLNDGNYIVGELKFGSDDPTSNVYKVDSETKEVSIYCTVPYKAALGAFVTEDVVYIACTSYGYSALCMCNDDGYVRSIHMEDVKTANDLMVMNNKVYMTDTSLDSEFNALGSSQLVIVDLQDETYRKLELTSYGVTGANGIVQSPSGTIIIADALGDGILIELTESGEFISSYPLEIFGDGIQWSQALNAYVMGRVTSEGVVMVDESLTKVQHISDEPCNAIGIDEEKMRILCPSLYDNRLTLIDMSPECGINAIPTEEPTDGGDDDCACDMSGYVSMDDFDALRAEVRELQGSLGNVEADNNDVMNAMEEMATCMSGIVDGFSGDDSYDTEEPMTEAPETSRMRTTVMETTTTMETTTKMPTLFPTARMTEKWETMAKLMDEGNNKCSTGADARAFRLTYTSLDNCVDRCYADERCMYASTDEVQWCIGCIQLDRASDGWSAYEMLRGRRQLSEVEQLRRENAALKAELARVRRN